MALGCHEGTHAPQQMPCNSTTSPARASRLSGIVILSSFAVLRIDDDLNLVDCSTGRSAGLVPLAGPHLDRLLRSLTWFWPGQRRRVTRKPAPIGSTCIFRQP